MARNTPPHFLFLRSFLNKEYESVSKICHMSHSTFCNQWNLGHVLIENVLFDTCQN